MKSTIAFLVPLYTGPSEGVPLMPSAHRKRQICAAQYISTGSKPARRVSSAPRRVACSVHATYG